MLYVSYNLAFSWEDFEVNGPQYLSIMSMLLLDFLELLILKNSHNTDFYDKCFNSNFMHLPFNYLIRLYFCTHETIVREGDNVLYWLKMLAEHIGNILVVQHNPINLKPSIIRK